MQFKPEVTLTNQNGWRLSMGDRSAPVAPEDVYLARAIAQGMGEIEQLKVLIAKAEGINEVAAAFRLAQFILEYGDFIAPDTEHYLITN